MQIWMLNGIGIIISLSINVAMAAENSAVFPISAAPALDVDKIQLGKQLYNEALFSANNSLSCASCHSLSKNGCDNLPAYRGINNQKGSVNTPTVLNTSLNFRFFWDARANSIGEVINDHLTDQTIFANNWPTLIKDISSKANYAIIFEKIFSEVINQQNIIEALTAYITTLVTPNSLFDKYLAGNKNALSPEALKGYQLFQKYGCVTCHQGQNLGGNLSLRFGIYKDFFNDRLHNSEADLGLFNRTKNPNNKYEFKVPSLRNVALTAPYLHDGSVNSLEEVIKIMGVYQVGQPIPSYEVPYIVKFLEALTGEFSK